MVIRGEGTVSTEGTLHEAVLEVCAEQSDRIALIDGASGVEVTYGTLALRVAQVASGLAARGLGAGDVVALHAPNSPQWAGAALGAMAAGCAATGVNPLYTDREVHHHLEDSGARLVIGKDGVQPPDLLADPRPLPEVAPSALALLPYSSGTIGAPKGVMLTHTNLVSCARQIQSGMRYRPGDVVLAVAPYFHSMGFMVTLAAPLLAGATVVTMPRFDLAEMLALIERHRVNCVVVPPPVVAALAHHPMAAAADLSSVEFIGCGGAPLPVAVQEALGARLPDVVIGQGYGLTETTVAITAPDRFGGGTRPGTVGRLAASTELRIVDPDTGIDLGRDGRGELWVRGPQVMAGYLNRPEATAEMIDADGWLRTGDIGVVEEDGSLRIVARAKELIKVNAFQVAPAELEALLVGHPAVADAAVVGRPDDRCGEVPIAYVVARAAVEPQHLMAWLAEQVAPYKRLADVHFIAAVPRTPSGKILRRELVRSERPPTRPATATAAARTPSAQPASSAAAT